LLEDSGTSGQNALVAAGGLRYHPWGFTRG
jgi:hypothetical protein